MLWEDASIWKFGLRFCQLNVPVDISVDVDPVRSGSKWKRAKMEEGLVYLPNDCQIKLFFPPLCRSLLQISLLVLRL